MTRARSQRDNRWTSLVMGLLTALVVPAVPVQAQQDDIANAEMVCPVDTPEADVVSRLRALSLDLRGTPASLEEIAAFDGLDDAAAAELEDRFVDEWLTSDAFAQRVVRRHRSLLWPNLSQIEFSTRTVAVDGRGIAARTDGNIQEVYRGMRGATCLDEPARFDTEGNVVTTPDAGARREGWVMVRPFWDPSTPVKVCAFDAQDALTADDGADCSSETGGGRRGCGCGPDLRWCLRSNDQTLVRNAMLEDLDRRVAANVVEDESYLDLASHTDAGRHHPI